MGLGGFGGVYRSWRRRSGWADHPEGDTPPLVARPGANWTCLLDYLFANFDVGNAGKLEWSLPGRTPLAYGADLRYNGAVGSNWDHFIGKTRLGLAGKSGLCAHPLPDPVEHRKRDASAIAHAGLERAAHPDFLLCARFPHLPGSLASRPLVAPIRDPAIERTIPLKRSVSIQILFFVVTRTVINTAIRMVYPLLPVFGRGLGVELPLLSVALTLRASSGIVGPFLAAMADRWGRKAGMLFGLALFTVGVSILVVWPSYLTFVAMLILTITGNFVFIPSMQAYLGDHVPYRRRGQALATTEFGWALSFILGVPLVSFLISRAGWQAPFGSLTCLGLLSLVILFFILPKEDNATAGKPSLLQNLRRVFTYPPALAGILVGLSISAGNELINLIFGVWIEESFGIQITTLAIAALIIGLSELTAEGLVSMLVDRIGKRKAIAAGLLLNSLAVLALPLLGRTLSGALTGLGLLYFAFEFTIVSSIPLMTEVLPEARATFMATYIAGMSLGRALGAPISPPLYDLGKTFGSGSGILVIAISAVVLNIIAYSSLRKVKTAPEEAE